MASLAISIFLLQVSPARHHLAFGYCLLFCLSFGAATTHFVHFSVFNLVSVKRHLSIVWAFLSRVGQQSARNSFVCTSRVRGGRLCVAVALETAAKSCAALFAGVSRTSVDLKSDFSIIS